MRLSFVGWGGFQVRTQSRFGAAVRIIFLPVILVSVYLLFLFPVITGLVNWRIKKQRSPKRQH